MSQANPALPIRYGVAAALLLAYAGASAWVVAREGEAYRVSLPRRAVQVDPPEAKPEPEPRPSPPAVALKPEPAPAPAPAPPPSRPEPKLALEPVAARPPAIDPFWEAPARKKVWDLDKLTAEDERQLGAALHEMVLHFHPRLEVGKLPKRMQDAAKPLLKTVARKDVEYTFTVLDCPHLNAFSHPGGYVYVCKGLFDQIGEDEDYALEFILAHEMAHVDLAHAVIDLKDPEVKKLFDVGTVALFYALPIPGGYLEKQEFEADRWVAEQMFKLGRDRYQILAFLRILEVYARQNGFENYRKKPGDPPLVPLFDNHIRAHPIPSRRLEEAKNLIDRLKKL